MSAAWLGGTFVFYYCAGVIGVVVRGRGGGLQLLFMLLSLWRNIRAEGLGPPEGSVSAQCVHPP